MSVTRHVTSYATSITTEKGTLMTEPSDRRGRAQDRFDAQGLGDVGDWLAAKRAAGLSWLQISYALRDLIGLDVSYETLRRWGLNDAEEGQ